jgi:uncharacterized protein (TIGR02118 family)
MSDALKITFCLRRLPSLTQAQFLDYWHTNHAPLVRKHAAALRIARYIQLVPQETPLSAPIMKARGAPEPFDGVAELWFASAADIEASMRDRNASAAGRELLEDERRFVDLQRSPLWYGRERLIIGAPTSLS